MAVTKVSTGGSTAQAASSTEYRPATSRPTTPTAMIAPPVIHDPNRVSGNWVRSLVVVTFQAICPLCPVPCATIGKVMDRPSMAAPAKAQWAMRSPCFLARKTSHTCPASTAMATRWLNPVAATASPYSVQLRRLGLSSARISHRVASSANIVAKAYGRASCPYRVIIGTTANSSPASTPVRNANIRRPRSPTRPAETAMASASGSRSIAAESPATSIHRCITA